MDQSGSWIVVRTKPRREDWAQLNVSQLGLQTFLPKFFCRLTKRVKILFPSYLFVRIKDQWWFLKTTFGVSHLIMWQDQPAEVPARHMRELQSRQDPADGLIHLDSFQLGQTIRIKDGPLSGWSGLYDGMKGEDRCRVMLAEFFGQPCTVEVGVGTVEAA